MSVIALIYWERVFVFRTTALLLVLALSVAAMGTAVCEGACRDTREQPPIACHQGFGDGTAAIGASDGLGCQHDTSQMIVAAPKLAPSAHTSVTLLPRIGVAASFPQDVSASRVLARPPGARAHVPFGAAAILRI